MLLLTTRSLLALCCCVSFFSANSLSLCADEVRFSEQIRPILAKKCFACHGPDESKRQTDWRIDQQQGLHAELEDGQAIVPHSPDTSVLFQRITAEDPELRMPPLESETKLAAEEIALIRRWIELGATWDQHWSFVPPQKSELPKVEQQSWPRNAIDRFVLARLEAASLAPSPQADRTALIRRVTFDLTGLPPTDAEVRAFLADDATTAYEALVDRLLASPAYGEHMARYWLDVARYADTHGLHLDNYREMWPYRDWVIRAFNENLPYDQFVVQQLAGDLLPEATLDQQIASGFNRCHVSTNEGGSIDEEVYVRNVVDRVSTTGTAMLGLTLGCAVCHDHKYDPISQREFYQLFAFFNSLDGPSMDGNVKDPAPSVRVPTDSQAAKLSGLREDIAALQAQRETILEKHSSKFEAWVQQRKQLRSTNSPDAALELTDGLLARFRLDEGAGQTVGNDVSPSQQGQFVGKPKWTEGPLGGALEFGQGAYVDLGEIGDFNKKRPFSFGAWLRTTGKVDAAAIAKTETREGIRGYELFVKRHKVAVLLSGRWPGYAIKVTSADDVLKRGGWHHVFVTYDGSSSASGVVLYIDGRPRAVHVNSDSLREKGSIGTDQALLLGRRDEVTEFAGGGIDDVRLYDHRLSDADVSLLYLGSQLAYTSELISDPPDEKLQEQLRKFYFIRHEPAYAQLTQKIDLLQSEIDHLQAEIPTTLVFRERDKPREAFVLTRGQYDQPGDPVKRSTPAFLPAMDEGWEANRLGLARWTVSPQHPLTSRVAVNRIWQQLFGVGIVNTAEDFGTQGASPTHPQLLDWLAVDFRQQGWDVKRLLKQLILSATYQQSSHVSPALQRRDPENRLLARGARFRMDAEMLRDQALAVSGLLVRKIGGPSVKPPQPGGLWFAVGYSGSNTVRFEQDSDRDNHYRRSLYTFWKRTSSPPQMSTFDAPSREVCIVRRERTNTPLQALLLMNDPQYVEAARHFAMRIMDVPLPEVSQRVAWAFEQAVARPPTTQELTELAAVYGDFLTTYDADREAAKALVEKGETPAAESYDTTELAAWTMVANVIFNLDEFLSKD
ncbi:MAG: DUF1553 domain-containing protein [Bythopirellula sp.]